MAQRHPKHLIKKRNSCPRCPYAPAGWFGFLGVRARPRRKKQRPVLVALGARWVGYARPRVLLKQRSRTKARTRSVQTTYQKNAYHFWSVTRCSRENSARGNEHRNTLS